MSRPVTVKLCHFDSGRLITESRCLEEVKNGFYAVSHVWGNATWRRIPGVDGDVLVSDNKARFIIEELPSAVGEHYFWMDVLCIDQADENERIGVVQHIPSIFRHAAKTIVVKDGKGIRMCCLDAMGAVDDWFDGQAGARVRLFDHIRLRHVRGLEEGVLQRLWPLQEIILSDHLQFLSCREPTREEENRSKNFFLLSRMTPFEF